MSSHALTSLREHVMDLQRDNADLTRRVLALENARTTEGPRTYPETATPVYKEDMRVEANPAAAAGATDQTNSLMGVGIELKNTTEEEEPDPPPEDVMSSSEYSLQESVWDSSLLLFMPQLGLSDSMCGLTALLVNMFVQGVLAVVVVQQLTGTTFGDADIASFRTWRTNIGHDKQYMDKISEQSLAARVCAGDAGLESSAAQANAYKTLSSYLSTNHVLGDLENGPAVLVCCAFVWSMSIVIELGATVKLCRGVYPLWASETTMRPSPMGVELASISSIRFAGFMSVQLVRFTIAVLLLIGGLIFLVNATSITDLLLNTVALEFILSVDEMAFATFAPAKLVQLLADTHPLHAREMNLSSLRSTLSLDLGSTASGGSVLLLLLVLVPLVIRPRITQLQEASDALCAGELNFVVTHTADLSMMWADSSKSSQSPTPRPWHRPESELMALDMNALAINALLDGYDDPEKCFKEKVKKSQLQSDKCSYGDADSVASGSVQHLLNYSAPNWGVPDCCWAYQLHAPSISAGPFSLASYERMSIDDATIVGNRACIDYLNDYSMVAFRGMDSFAKAVHSIRKGGKPHETYNLSRCEAGCFDRYRPLCREGQCVSPSCSDAAEFCNQDSAAGQISREYCPDTCGCFNARADQPLNAANQGCGPICAARYMEEQSTNTRLKCTDTPIGNEMNRYTRSLDKASLAWPGTQRYYTAQISQHLKRSGCSILLALAGFGVPLTTICGDLFGDSVRGFMQLPITPLAALCPVSCGCVAHPTIFGCPAKCADGAANTTTSSGSSDGGNSTTGSGGGNSGSGSG